LGSAADFFKMSGPEDKVIDAFKLLSPSRMPAALKGCRDAMRDAYESKDARDARTERGNDDSLRSMDELLHNTPNRKLWHIVTVYDPMIVLRTCYKGKYCPWRQAKAADLLGKQGHSMLMFRPHGLQVRVCQRCFQSPNWLEFECLAKAVAEGPDKALLLPKARLTEAGMFKLLERREVVTELMRRSAQQKIKASESDGDNVPPKKRRVA